MAITIAITNQKGGVGKTTTCSAFCGGLTDCGHSVLAIDLDPQGNLSFSLGAEAEDNYTMYDVFKGNCDIKDAIQCTPNCDVVAANILLSGCELELTGVGREYILREALSQVEDEYDYIIIDTPPVLLISDALALTSSVDGVSVVCRHQSSYVSDVSRALSALKFAKANILGVIVNDYKEIRQAKYGYKNYYYYSSYEYKETIYYTFNLCDALWQYHRMCR